MTNHHQSDAHRRQQGDIWLQYFACCFTTQQPHHPGKRRPMRLDPSMIGLPTNFQHTGHVGCNDLGLNTNHMVALHSQLQSKGGYNMAIPIAAASNRNNLLSLDTRPLLSNGGSSSSSSQHNVVVMTSSSSRGSSGQTSPSTGPPPSAAVVVAGGGSGGATFSRSR